MSALHLADDLALPIDYVTKTCAILAQRRKGKTYTASVLAEELVDAGIPWVALDPTGAWWGLRAGADGDPKGGLPVTILGGHHGDIPLERTSGKLIAELVVEQPGWYVLDLGLFESKEADRQFATDFAERLYRRKGQEGGDTALHVFVDEADLFVPQQSPSGDKRMVGAFETLVRRGGIRGIGTTLISQRAAVVNKNVLEMLDMLVVLRTVGPNDRRAIDGYIEAYATDEQQKLVMDSLAALDIGQAWIYEPGEQLLQQVRVRERRTFNSSATPKAGEKRVEPKRLAAVDLEAVKEQMADTIERAKQEDPKELRREIIGLRRQVAELEAREPDAAEPIEVEVPVFYVPESVREQLAIAQASAEGIAQGIAGVIVEIQENATQDRPGGATPAGSAPRRAPTPPNAASAAARPASRPTRTSPEPADTGDVRLERMDWALLGVLVQRPNGLTRDQVALFAGYSPSSGAIDKALARLRRLDWITKGGARITPTTAGIENARPADPLPTGPDLLAALCSDGGLPNGFRMERMDRAFLGLIAAQPGELTRDDVAERAGYSASSGAVDKALGRLRRIGFVAKGQPLRLTDDFAEAIT